MKRRMLPLLIVVLVLTAPLVGQVVVPRNADRDAIPPHTRGMSAPSTGCTIQNNNTGDILGPGVNGDVLYKLLTAQPFCPENALIFRNLAIKNGLVMNPTMVANRGFRNPLQQGSFSFFEGITGSYGGQTLALGDWFFGHFTAASIDSVAGTAVLVPQQSATPDNLLLETLIFDPTKGAYNFYEIRGTGEGGLWFYRGDSFDIQKDIANLDRNRNPGEPIFMGPVTAGQPPSLPRLRCSGCHMNGGPIMKELKGPHDSWWTTQRPLLLGALRIAPEFVPIFNELNSADKFSGWIKTGDEKLINSAPYWDFRSKLSLQEQLRPLFCEQEVNLESDSEPFATPGRTSDIVRAPVGLFVDQRMVPGVNYIDVSKAIYTNTLNAFQSNFLDYQSNGPVTNQIDADHAWETPVKSHSDMLLAQKMIATGLIDEKFAFDVLGIDFTRPMFSPARCGTLRLLPDGPPAAGWKQKFMDNLAASQSAGAKELLANMKDASRTPAWHRKRAADLVAMIQKNAANQDAVNGYVRLLAERRIAVFQDQVSQHPQGQIFEPGFRLIFPTMQLFAKNQQQIAYGGVPGQFWLNPRTGLVELTPP